MQDLIGYDEIIEGAMRNVIYEILKKIEKDGLKGSHYFVISFATKHKGVLIPKYLKEKFPEEMMIILQHQFGSLVISKTDFKITLNFSGKPEKLTIPFRAITSFADPSISFGLKFSILNLKEDAKDGVVGAKGKKNKNVDLSAKVISLDAFRKNRDNKDNNQ